jgi:disulfide bond formation protein DsbB
MPSLRTDAYELSASYLPAAILAASLAALGSAVAAQYVWGLEPCILCLYQRIPYAVAALLGLAGLFCAPGGRTWIGAAAGVVFVAGACIAFYHVGVEQHWWRSATSCGAEAGQGPLSFEEFRRGLAAKPEIRCDQVAWSLFGLSMATYNVALSLGLAAGSVGGAWVLGRGRAA